GVMANDLGMGVYYYDVEEKLRIGNAISCKTLEELLNTCDIISLHVPDIPQTKNLINKETIAQMKDGSFLINYARGSVVDIDALDEALTSGKICGAALDVFPSEPASNAEKFISAMTKHKNVLLTPHIGGSTTEAQSDIGINVSKKLIKNLQNGSTDGSVNMPTMNIPARNGSIRINHIHNNVPGIMRQINRIISKKNINIEGQFLQTNSSIGYCVLDINLENSTTSLPEIISELESIEGTIKVRNF
ncbi:TPA: phosphoglycerate dehydrogenase, partial [Candidatus Peregrinibacteria bacterium]|nr:phosphoglycerate dehydrogenase [Candidatus Peregrinibacteria bacterium]